MACHLPETLLHLVDDHQAFEKVMERLYRVAFHMVHNHQDVEDIVQQSWLNALHGADTFHRQCLVTTWLCRIVRNQAYKLLHQRQRFPHFALEQEAVSLMTANVEPAWNTRIDHALILTTLPKLLSTVEAELVHLHYVDGWSCKEIADYAGRTPSAIRQILCRALSKLRRHFTKDQRYEQETPKAGRHSGRLLRRVVGRTTCESRTGTFKL